MQVFTPLKKISSCQSSLQQKHYNKREENLRKVAQSKSCLFGCSTVKPLLILLIFSLSFPNYLCCQSGDHLQENIIFGYKLDKEVREWKHT
jgi:hypothetical protein